MNTLSSNDLLVLSQYHFVQNGSNKQNNVLLGVKWIKDQTGWKQQLIEVDKQDVTCWSLFLSLFRVGKLAHTSVSLSEVNYYLTKYDWKKIKTETNISLNSESSASIDKAFNSVCHVANRSLSQSELFYSVSDVVSGDFNHYWNPALEGSVLYALQRPIFRYAVNIELRFKDTKVRVSENQRLTKEDVSRIEVGYAYERIPSYKKRVPDHFSEPRPPYYWTGPVKI